MCDKASHAIKQSADTYSAAVNQPGLESPSRYRTERNSSGISCDGAAKLESIDSCTVFVACDVL